MSEHRTGIINAEPDNKALRRLFACSVFLFHGP